VADRVPQEETERYRTANTALVALASGDLAALWRSLDLSRPTAARNALLEAVPLLTTVHGESAAVIAADWYDEMRALQRIPGRFRARMAPPVPVEVVESRVRYGARHLFTETPDQTLRFLDNATSEYVLQPGRDTIQQSAVADPRAVGWHRETRPSQSYASGCGFCQMLAGRGGVYKWESAPFAAHGNCQCVAVPSWDADAEEVPVSAYVASRRTAQMSAAEKARHNAYLRDYVNAYFPTTRTR